MGKGGLAKDDILWDMDWAEVLKLEHAALCAEGVRCRKPMTARTARQAEQEMNMRIAKLSECPMMIS